MTSSNTLYSPTRAEIQRQINSYFEMTMSVEERVFQSLEFMPIDDFQNRISALWKNTVLFYPALACIMQNLMTETGGYDEFINSVMPVKTEKYSIESDKYNRLYMRLLRNFFSDRRHKKIYNPQGLKIQSDGKLSILDLLLGSLNLGTVNNQTNPLVYGAYKANKKDGVDYQTDAYNIAKNIQQQLISGFNNIKKVDTSVGDQQFVIYNEENKFKILPASTWSSSYYLQNSSDRIHLQRENVIQHSNILFGDESLEQLEFLINTDAKESEFQSFFTKYPEYITSLGNYARLHPQLILHEDDGKNKIPDFFLERFDNSFCDICELKKPSDKLTKDIYNLRSFKDRIHIALQQISNYRDYFDDKANRDKFFNTYNLKAFKPRVILVIGRNSSFYDDMDRIKLEDRIFNDKIKLYTYDDIAENAKRWLRYASR